jgi:hypothetical protein
MKPKPHRRLKTVRHALGVKPELLRQRQEKIEKLLPQVVAAGEAV